MSIITNPDARAGWLRTVSALVLQLQLLETQISIGMLEQPTSRQSISLMLADQQLGVAATALTEAAAQIRKMR